MLVLDYTSMKHLFVKSVVLVSGAVLLLYGATTKSYVGTFSSLPAAEKDVVKSVVVPVYGSAPGITLSFAGNTMLGADFFSYSRNNSTASLDALFSGSKKLTLADDATIVNLETPVSYETSKAYTTKFGIEALDRAGVDAVALGGKAFTSGTYSSVARTLSSLTSLGMQWTGLGESADTARRLLIFQKGDLSFGVMSVSDISNKEYGKIVSYPHVARVRDLALLSTIKKASQSVDALTVVVHVSGKSAHTYRDELLGRLIIDAGADAVIFYGPQDVFDVEQYRGGMIAYSLGDFVSGEGDSDPGMIMQLSLSDRGVFTSKAYEVVHAQSGAVTALIPSPNQNTLSIESDYMRVLGSKTAVYNTLSVYERSRTAKGKVAITIDDGYDIDNVRDMIAVFEQKKAKATFFPAAEQLIAYSSVWKKAVPVGIEFGNHTFTHPWITHITPSELGTELQKAKAAILKINPSARVVWFRPPNKDGFTEDSWLPDTHSAVLKQNGLQNIALWSLDSYADYHVLAEGVDGKVVGEDLASRAKAGDIIILHFSDTDLAALPYLIDNLRAKGLEPVTMSELIAN